MGCVFFVSLSVSLAHTSLSSCHCSPRCRIALSHIRYTHVIIIIIIVLYTVAAIPVVVVGHHGGIGIPCVYIRAYNILLCVWVCVCVCARVLLCVREIRCGGSAVCVCVCVSRIEMRRWCVVVAAATETIIRCRPTGAKNDRRPYIIYIYI